MQPFPTLPDWVTLEHQFAQILTDQETHGWYFDESAARELECSLRNELQSIVEYFREIFVPGAEFTPKRNNRTQGYFQDCPFTRLKTFNPSSRDHIAWILKTRVISGETSTTSGKTKIDETTLKNHGTGLSLQFLRIWRLRRALG